MSKIFLIPVSLLALSPAVPAQNYLSVGDFQNGDRWWTESTTDPKGSVGYRLADITNTMPSEAAFAEFKTLGTDVSATFRTAGFTMYGGQVPVTFHVLWDKGTVTTPIGSPQDNWVELRVLDGQATERFKGRLSAPGQSGKQERATFRGTMNGVPFQALRAELLVHHSSQAKIAYTTLIDDVWIGTPNSQTYYRACKSIGGRAPQIDAYLQPVIGGRFVIQLKEAAQRSPAVLAIGASNDRYGPITLPYDLGGGCLLLQDLAITRFVLTGGIGTHQTTFQIPNNAGYRGANLYFQFACADPRSPNPAGFTTSAGLKITVR